MRLQGFTLIESILVTSIVLLLGAFSAIFGTQFTSTRSVAVTAHILRESLDRAQVYAHSGRSGSDWGVTEVSGTIVIFSGESYALRVADLDESATLPDGVSIAGLDETVFSQVNGQLSAAKIIDVTGSDRTLHLSVSSEGAVNEYE